MISIDPKNTLDLELPDQFGRYTLLGHLATGGMAEVWLARQVGMEGFEKTVVIKRARPELTDRDTTRLFLDEARLVATLEHPNIAQVYEIGQVSGSYFFVMEYVEGADLRRLIEASLAKRQRVPLADALYIMTHVCAALHYAHEKRDPLGRPLHLVHRDVSPSNVLLSHDGAIKVCDFGIAKAHNREAEDTHNGVLKGKFSYMSPEQCEGRPIDRRSDVFSIGILLYELTTLTKLFRASSDYALLQKIVQLPIPPPSSRIPDYPPELERIVMKALGKSPDERYPTAQAMQLDLEELAREHKLATSSIRIAALMANLFDRRGDARLRVPRSSGRYNEQTPVSVSSNGPAFVAVGSAPQLAGDASETPTAGAGRASASQLAATTSATATVPPTARTRSHRSPALLLVGAVLSGMVAAAVTVADQMIAKAEDREAAAALVADSERIAAVFDTSARSAHLRVDGIAATPMLRAAIETDAATLRDLANTEMVFTADPGDTFEVFQLRGDRPMSLLRIPKLSPALAPMTGRSTRIVSDGHVVALLASAPIAGYGGHVAGEIVLAMAVDLASVQRTIGEHAARATLTGLGKDFALTAGSATAGNVATVGALTRLAVPSSGGWTNATATLVAVPRKATGLSWAWQARTMSGGLGALLLIGFVVSLARRPRT